MENRKGHILTLITVLIWGTTFISTKILLTDFKPFEILFFRFLIGLIALIIIYPKRLKSNSIKHELIFAGAGLSGICLYYLFENIALTYTTASNVGVIISIAPFFTAILSHFTKTKEQLKINFFIGFFFAMTGICLISFNGLKFELNFIGDILAVFAALLWAIYSLLIKEIGNYGYNIIQTTRKTFLYGIIFMLPILFIFDFDINIIRFSNPIYLFNISFLGLGASAICFVTWNYAVKILGAIKTSIYIYIVPVITVITSALILKEKITIISIIGTTLTIVGLLISERLH